MSRREKEVEDGVLSTVVGENYVSLDLRPYSDSNSYRELKKEKTSCRLFNREDLKQVYLHLGGSYRSVSFLLITNINKQHSRE